MPWLMGFLWISCFAAKSLRLNLNALQWLPHAKVPARWHRRCLLHNGHSEVPGTRLTQNDVFGDSPTLNPLPFTKIQQHNGKNCKKQAKVCVCDQNMDIYIYIIILLILIYIYIYCNYYQYYIDNLKKQFSSTSLPFHCLHRFVW